jgi:predicted dehydrogenase
MRIGFADYKLENFHANVFLRSFRDALQERGAVVTGCYALDEENGRAWAAKNNVPYFADPHELDAQVDCYMILAPSNPETHLDLARKFVPFGKPTYVDKTFAPDLATAKQIFELADQHDTPRKSAAKSCGTWSRGAAAARLPSMQFIPSSW